MEIHINLYFENGAKLGKARDTVVGYILEYITEKGPATYTKFERLENVTSEQAAALGLSKAFEEKWAKKSDEITVYTDDPALKGAYGAGYMQKWIEKGWVTAGGKEKKHREEWETVNELITAHKVDFVFDQGHSYRNYLRHEVQKRINTQTK